MSRQRANPRKVVSSFGLKVPGAFYSPNTLFEAVAIFKLSWIGLILTPLERYRLPISKRYGN